jgi:hypothetical protein
LSAGFEAKAEGLQIETQFNGVDERRASEYSTLKKKGAIR